MTHAMWVLLITIVSANPSTGEINTSFEVEGTYMRPQACMEKAAPMQKEAQKVPELTVTCLQVEHPMIW